MKHLYRINLPYACFGIDITDNICTEAPPIAKWMIGKSFGVIQDYVLSKKGTVEFVTELKGVNDGLHN